LRTILVIVIDVKPRSALLLSLGFVVALLGAGCSTTTTNPTTTAGKAPSGSAGSATGGTPVPGRTIKVVSTTTQLADFTRAIGGSGVEAYGVLKANVDAHDFEPSPADIQAIADADVIVRNGVDLEKWFDKTIEAAQPKGVLVDASEGVTLRVGEAHEEDEGEHEDEASDGPVYDPHIWHNPLNAKIMVANIAKAFEQANPDGAASYKANLDAYTDQLDQLDREIKTQFDGLTNKKLVTNHDAFHYYVDRYGLEFVGSIIPSFDSSAEMSVSEREDLIAKIKEHRVKAVFSESSLPPKTADAIAEEAGVKIVQGDDSLYGDSLGPEGSDGATYLDMLRHNTEVIVDNLR